MPLWLPVAAASAALSSGHAAPQSPPNHDRMLYLLYRLSDQFQGFNLFRYITFRSGGAVLTALLISFIFGPRIIAWLKEKQGEGQPIRSDGPQSHLVRKKGTPTMGGVLILLALSVSTLLWTDLANPYVWIVLVVTVGFGLIGFCDDFRKLTTRSHHGVPGGVKLLVEIVVAAAACIALALIMRQPLANTIAVPFFKTVLLERRLVLPAVRRPGDRWRVQFGQSDRRARRAGDRAGDDRRRRLRPDRLPRRQRRLLQLPAASPCAARRRADGVLRRDGRRQHRLSVVQCAARRSVYGRYRIAVARRRAGDDQRRHQTRAGAGDHRRDVRAGGGVGHGPGGELQADRPPGFSAWRRCTIISSRWAGRSRRSWSASGSSR